MGVSSRSDQSTSRPGRITVARGRPTSRPLHVAARHNRLIVLDGIHRLLKATWLGHSTVRVVEVPERALRKIAV